MTSSLFRLLTLVGLVVAPIVFLDTLVKSTLLLVFVLLLCASMRQASAARKHYLLGLTMTSLCVIPVLSVLGPQLRILPASWTLAQDKPSTQPIAALPNERAIPLDATEPASIQEVKPVTTTPDNLLVKGDVPPLIPALVPQEESFIRSPVGKNLNERSLTQWPPIFWQSIATLWLLGCSVFLVRLVIAMLRLRRVVGQAKAVEDVSSLELVERLRNVLGTSRRVFLLQGAHAAMPMTWGIWRARILLPDNFGAWPEGRKRMVLLHEMAHVQRYDCAWLMLTELVRAFFWFHPLVWLVARQMTALRERACDDQVLAAGYAPTVYAEQLLFIAAHNSRAMPANVAIGMARSNQLESRVGMILDSARNRSGLDRNLAGGFALLLAVIVIPLALARAVEPLSDGIADDELSGEITLNDVIDGIEARQAKYREAEFQIAYEIDSQGVAGTLPYVLRLRELGRFTIRDGTWFCETEMNPPTQSLGPWRDRRWHVGNVRVSEREFQAQEGKSPYTKHRSYNSHRIPFHLDKTLVRAIYGPDDWLIKDWQKFAKDAQLKIEEKRVGNIDCVFVTTGDGPATVFAPKYDWALVEFYFGITLNGYEQHEGYWLPKTITERAGNFKGEDLINRVLIKEVKLKEQKAKTTIVLPPITADTEVEVFYPYWQNEWDEEPVDNELVIQGAVGHSYRFKWGPDGALAEKDQIVWEVSKYWRDRSIVNDSIESGKPLPFLSKDNSKIIWACFDRESTQLRRIEISEFGKQQAEKVDRKLTAIDHTVQVGDLLKHSGTIRGKVRGLPDQSDEVKYAITLDYEALERLRKQRQLGHPGIRALGPRSPGIVLAAGETFAFTGVPEGKCVVHAYAMIQDRKQIVGKPLQVEVQVESHQVTTIGIAFNTSEKSTGWIESQKIERADARKRIN